MPLFEELLTELACMMKKVLGFGGPVVASEEGGNEGKGEEGETTTSVAEFLAKHKVHLQLVLLLEVQDSSLLHSVLVSLLKLLRVCVERRRVRGMMRASAEQNRGGGGDGGRAAALVRASAPAGPTDALAAIVESEKHIHKVILDLKDARTMEPVGACCVMFAHCSYFVHTQV